MHACRLLLAVLYRVEFAVRVGAELLRDLGELAEKHGTGSRRGELALEINLTGELSERTLVAAGAADDGVNVFVNDGLPSRRNVNVTVAFFESSGFASRM